MPKEKESKTQGEVKRILEKQKGPKRDDSGRYAKKPKK
jgi:hypothetical protein